jgi:hypothetical protein
MPQSFFLLRGSSGERGSRLLQSTKGPNKGRVLAIVSMKFVAVHERIVIVATATKESLPSFIKVHDTHGFSLALHLVNQRSELLTHPVPRQFLFLLSLAR